MKNAANKSSNTDIFRAGVGFDCLNKSYKSQRHSSIIMITVEHDGTVLFVAAQHKDIPVQPS